ncbi:trypsin-like peptidase domain-containing protein [Corticibacterium sp. UT-5YL-CI-8]|nr:trypsin-like peptidase domain-containing protein [Tianweitania sp. UT-5YL-CI-8]
MAKFEIPTAPAVSMSAPHCLRIINANRTSGGSAFVIKRGGSLWLMTAAHVPTGRPSFQDFSTWPTEVTVCTPTGEFQVQIINAGTPLFQIYQSPESGEMSDAIALPIAHNFGAKVYELSPNACASVRIGDRLSMRGFPSRSYPTRWPPTNSALKVYKIEQRALFVSSEIVTGNSGGPLFDRHRNLVGMAIGSTAGRGVIVRNKHLEDLFA